MSRIKLKSIVSEIIKEMVDTHPIHQKINNKLMQIARRGFESEEDERYVGDADKGNKILFEDKNFDVNEMYVEELKYFLKCVLKKQKTFNDIEIASKILKYSLVKEYDK